jgi:hypothetical protein
VCTHRTFVSYIDRSREYYRALGYDRPYRWASHADAPFTGLGRPLAQSRIGLVTTASLHDRDPDAVDLPPQLPCAAPLSPLPERLHTRHRAWAQESTHTDDLASFFPAAELLDAANRGRIGSVAPRFYSVPTEYSHRQTLSVDAPAILGWMREDAVDVALLVAL